MKEIIVKVLFNGFFTFGMLAVTPCLANVDSTIQKARSNYLIELLSSKELLGERGGQRLWTHNEGYELLKKDEQSGFSSSRCQSDLFVDIYHESTIGIPKV